jgi:hypothetical protein
VGGVAALAIVAGLAIDVPPASAETVCGQYVAPTIYGKYLSVGGEGGRLGCATAPGSATPDEQALYSHFVTGSIYWRPWVSGARPQIVEEPIRQKWASIGWERSALGYPVFDTLPTPDLSGVYNLFERGAIYHSAASGTHVIAGAIRDEWASLGWEKSFLGFPTDDGPVTGDGRANVQRFQKGVIADGRRVTGVQALDKRFSDGWFAHGGPTYLLGLPTSESRRVGTTLNNHRIVEFENAVLQSTLTAAPHLRAPTFVLDANAVLGQVATIVDDKLRAERDKGGHEVRRRGAPRLRAAATPPWVGSDNLVHSRLIRVSVPLELVNVLWDPTFTLNFDLEVNENHANQFCTQEPGFRPICGARLEATIQGTPTVTDIAIPAGTRVGGTTASVACRLLFSVCEVERPTNDKIRDGLLKVVNPMVGVPTAVALPPLISAQVLPDSSLRLYSFTREGG